MIEQRNLLDLFELRQALSARRNLSFEQIDDAWAVTKVRARVQIESFILRVPLELMPIRHDQRGWKLATVADNNDLIHKARSFDELLDWLRRNVFAAGSFQQLLLAIGNCQVPICVEVSDISGFEPTIIGHYRASLFRLVPIALHHVRTACFNLTVGSNANFDIANRFTGSANANVVELARGNYGRSFSQPVPLYDRQTSTQKCQGDIISQRRAARHQYANASTHRFAQLFVNQDVAQFVLQPQPGRDA